MKITFAFALVICISLFVNGKEPILEQFQQAGGAATTTEQKKDT